MGVSAYHRIKYRTSGLSGLGLPIGIGLFYAMVCTHAAISVACLTNSKLTWGGLATQCRRQRCNQAEANFARANKLRLEHGLGHERQLRLHKKYSQICCFGRKESAVAKVASRIRLRWRATVANDALRPRGGTLKAPVPLAPFAPFDPLPHLTHLSHLPGAVAEQKLGATLWWGKWGKWGGSGGRGTWGGVRFGAHVAFVEFPDGGQVGQVGQEGQEDRVDQVGQAAADL